MSHTSDILHHNALSLEDITALLSTEDKAEGEAIRVAAHELLLSVYGPKVYYRGLIEFSNECINDCLYCGIRLSNDSVSRYALTREEIVESALWSADQGYGSVVLQSGERTDPSFIDFVESIVNEIKHRSVSLKLPQGVGITLCVGEQTEATYRRFFAAGAHRYLLRIESSSPTLYARLHPPAQTFTNRISCLQTLKRIGYQVGTGVMIGLPGQTIEDLANDIIFFKNMDVDMIGMGPYIPHGQTPMAQWPETQTHDLERAFQLALRMIAVTRLALVTVNIAATTALQAIHHDGREQGLLHGANIIMPTVTPTRVRSSYLLYEGKPCLDESADQCRGCLERRIHAIGREIGYGAWGDSKHAQEPHKD